MDMNEEKRQEEMSAPNEGAEKVEVREDPEALSARIKELQDEKDQLFARLQRALADLQNTQKRAIKDRQEAIQRTELLAIERFVFPVIDDLDRALKAASEHGYKSDDPLSHGVNVVLQHVFGLLKQLNIEPIDAEGKAFDPLYHEAIMELAAGSDVPENTVIQVLSRGYAQDGRTIRPVRVAIAKSEKKAAASEEQAESKYQDDGEKLG